MEVGEMSFVLFQVTGYVFRYAITLALISWPLFIIAKLFGRI